jgi:photosystem II stability/assembly factor-like uncharacterized protein
MTPEERDLRRALDARSGEPSQQFRARLTAAFAEGRPASGLMQAVAMVAVIAITLGTVGVLLLSRGANRVSYGGTVSGPRYTVTTKLMTKAGDRVVACWFEYFSLPPPVCGGATVTNVDVAAISGTKTLSNGVVETPNVRLVGTWDGHALRLTERPRLTTVGRTQFEPVAQPMPPSPAKPTAEVLREITRDHADLQKRGVSLMEWGEGSDGLPYLKLAVADAASVQYLYDHYGRVNISGWLQPVDSPPAPTPSPSPILVPQTPIVLPTTAELSAPSKDVVWALVASTLLFRSTDRGTTWEQRTLPPRAGGGSPPVFSFVDADNGWYFVGGVPETQCNGAGAEVWRTTDGAATWQHITLVEWTQPAHTDSGIAYAQCKDGVSFIDPTHGFLGGWDPNHRPTVYRTSDGGKTWSASALPDPPGFVSQAGGSTLRLRLVKGFGGTLLALADANRAPAYVFRSTDGGATWAYLATANSASLYPTFVTASRWLVIGNDGSGIETTDSGRSWHQFSSDYADAAGVGSTFVFGDSNIGYGTVRGGLHRTVDGGSHWIRIATPGTVAPRATPSPTSSPTALLPVTDPGFTCRLAVGTGSFGSSSNGGFVAVPRGAFEPDPAGSMLEMKGRPWIIETPSQPVLRGTTGLSFDVPLARWVPAGAEMLSSDGTTYVWTERQVGAPNLLHLTKVADGSDRTFAVGPPQDPDVRGSIPVPLALTAGGALLTYGWEGNGGVWRLDFANGSLTKLSGQRDPIGYSAGAVWLDPLRGNTGVGSAHTGDTLARLDLSSGAVVDWFHRDNLAVRYAGTDAAGNPWVVVNPGRQGTEFWRVRSPGQADLILSGQNISKVFTDKHGTWFANETGVYLHAADRLQRVSSASVGEVVGPCI